MKIHEYQAKQLFAKYKIQLPDGEVVCTHDRARAAAQRLGGRVVVKAQVHIGGRGKAGGVKLAENPEEAERAASDIIGMSIKGLIVEKVLIERALDIASEYYLGITLDRAARSNVVMVSAMGGVDIEEVAATHPEAIVTHHIDPLTGVLDFEARRLVAGAGLNQRITGAFVDMLNKLLRCFADNDCSLAEINPLAVTGEGVLVAADAKINIDDNALFRQSDVTSLREEHEEDLLEAEAQEKGLAYVRLEGEVGIIGNGAGLTMASLDAVQGAGGRPANFLDIGGGAQADIVSEGMKLILKDPNVKGLLINIFGGITRCDEVAKGILKASQTIDGDVPMVIRLTGTREEEGRKLLVGTPLITAATMAEAAKKIVELTM